jgi:hypothetical protein
MFRTKLAGLEANLPLHPFQQKPMTFPLYCVVMDDFALEPVFTGHFAFTGDCAWAATVIAATNATASAPLQILIVPHLQ